MGCSACAAAAAAARAASGNTRMSQTATASSEPCIYTDYILNVWLDKLKWFKDTGKYVKYKVEARTLNKYLGVVLTTLNVNNKCVYKDTLDEISKLITLINGIQ